MVQPGFVAVGAVYDTTMQKPGHVDRNYCTSSK